MKSVYKYPVGQGLFVLRMPLGAKPLSAQVQNEQPQLWALVDTDNDHVDHRFYTIGTGHPFPQDAGEFIDTIQLLGGQLVFHIFDGGEV